jgi:hypothetical protein
MKKKSLKIADHTLFVYKSTRVNNNSETTEPTTTMVTLTVTGVYNSNRKQEFN